uniref:(northern house mosquito) hypothetical protein n=1 Tax=Culex pipiens TaxID=7175 RepID=A0A8D8EUD7_CULPI
MLCFVLTQIGRTFRSVLRSLDSPPPVHSHPNNSAASGERRWVSFTLWQIEKKIIQNSHPSKKEAPFLLSCSVIVFQFWTIHSCVCVHLFQLFLRQNFEKSLNCIKKMRYVIFERRTK